MPSLDSDRYLPEALCTIWCSGGYNIVETGVPRYRKGGSVQQTLGSNLPCDVNPELNCITPVFCKAAFVNLTESEKRKALGMAYGTDFL